MKYLTKLLLQSIVVLLFFPQLCFAQNESYAIPSSPAFSLLGVTPEYISKPSNIKDFKVDWRIKNYKVAPDLAIEGQPLYWLYYSKKGIRHYKTGNNFSKILASTSLSLGTAKIDGLNHLAYAFKWNILDKPSIIKEHVLDSLIIIANLEEQRLIDEIDSMSIRLKLVKDYSEKIKLRNQIDHSKNQLHQTRKDLVANYQAFLSNPNFHPWNMDYAEFAIGKVHTYDNGAIDSLNFNDAGWGAWLSAGKGIGINSLLSFIIKYQHIGSNHDLLLGTSYRFGNERFNFFTELIYFNKGNSFNNGFAEDEYFLNKFEEDLGNGWIEFAEGERQQELILSYGGEFKLRRNIMLNFSLKTKFNAQLNFERLIPVANLTCLMQ